MTNDEALALFERSGAVRDGHFVLSSGLHSDRYLEKFRLVEDPALLEPVCVELAARFREARPDLVLGPTTAGIIVAYTVARHLGVGARFAEREGEGRALRRGQTLAPGLRVLVVDDILTTGGSVRDCIDLVRSHGASPAGVGVLADRSGGRVDLGTRLEAVLSLPVAAYPPDECPLCRLGAPLEKPGTTPGVR